MSPANKGHSCPDTIMQCRTANRQSIVVEYSVKLAHFHGWTRWSPPSDPHLAFHNLQVELQCGYRSDPAWDRRCVFDISSIRLARTYRLFASRRSTHHVILKAFIGFPVGKKIMTPPDVSQSDTSTQDCNYVFTSNRLDHHPAFLITKN